MASGQGHGAVLVVNEGFTAFGVDYEKRDIIPNAHHRKWPRGTLAKRLEHGFVSWESPDTEESDAEDDEAGDDSDGASETQESKGTGHAKAPVTAPRALPADLPRNKEALVKYLRRAAPWVQKIDGFDLRTETPALFALVEAALAKGEPKAAV